jgi:hypothetical protein
VAAGRAACPQEAGLVLLPMGVLAALISRPISARNLIHGPLVVGAVSMILASVAVLFFRSATPVLAIVAVTLLFAITLGTTAVVN